MGCLYLVTYIRFVNNSASIDKRNQTKIYKTTDGTVVISATYWRKQWPILTFQP